MTAFVSRPAPDGLRASLRVPGDKSISHRVLLLAALGEGRSHLTDVSTGSDVRHTLAAVRAFGAEVAGHPPGELVIDGGAGRLREPDRVIDVGNSGTGIRLIAGWATRLSGLTVLAGDTSIARRPMDRVADPLRAMGASIDGRDGGRLPPLVVRGGRLHGIDYRLPVPSAQVKGAVLLAALAADGPTTVREDLPTRMHTEELLALAGADIERVPGVVTVRPGPLRPFRTTVPGDPSQAAFWLVAASITPGSDVTVRDVYVGPGRAGWLEVLRRMGAAIEVAGEDPATGTATLRARSAPLRATAVGGVEVPSLIDEIPVLAVAAAYAEGTTTFADAAELRVKESDRVTTVVEALRAVGAEAEPRPDGLVVHGGGGRPLPGGTGDSRGDHRVAMSLAVAGLAAAGPVTVHGWAAVATSYPTFEQDYARCVS